MCIDNANDLGPLGIEYVACKILELSGGQVLTKELLVDFIEEAMVLYGSL